MRKKSDNDEERFVSQDENPRPEGSTDLPEKPCLHVSHEGWRADLEKEAMLSPSRGTYKSHFNSLVLELFLSYSKSIRLYLTHQHFYIASYY